MCVMHIKLCVCVNVCLCHVRYVCECMHMHMHVFLLHPAFANRRRILQNWKSSK